MDFTPTAATSSNRDLRLYDAAIQTLVAAGLKLEYCSEMISEGPIEAVGGIDAVLNSISQLIDDIRYRMRELSSTTMEITNV